MARLTDKQKTEIRDLRESGITLDEIASQMGLAKSTVSRNLSKAAPRIPDELDTFQTRTYSPYSSLIMQGKQQLGEVMDSYLLVNPATYLVDVVATNNTAAAHGLIYARDSALYNLFSQMLNSEPAVASAMDQLVSSVLSKGHYFKYGEDDGVDPVVAKAVEKYIEGFGGFEDLLWNGLRGMASYGFSAHEIIYKVENGLIVPEHIIMRHPSHFLMDEYGGLWPCIDGAYQPAQEGKFIVMRNGGEFGNMYGESLCFPIRYDFWWLKYLTNNYIEYVQSFAVPIITVVYQQEQSDAVKNEMLGILRQLGSFQGNGIVVDHGGEIKAVDRSSGGAGNSIHRDAIELLKREITHHILGSTLTTLDPASDAGGNRAMGAIHQRNSDTRLIIFGHRVSRAINEFLIRPFVEMNFPGAVAPTFCIDVDNEIDLTLAIQALETAKRLDIDSSKKQAMDWLGLEDPRDENDSLLHPPHSDGGAPPPSDDGSGSPPEQPPSETLGSPDAAGTIGGEDTEDLKAYSSPKEITALSSGTAEKVINAQVKNYGVKDEIVEYVLPIFQEEIATQVSKKMKQHNLTNLRFDLSFMAPILIGLRMASCYTVAEIKKTFSAKDDNNNIYADAVEWFRSRKVLSIGELTAMVEAAEELYPSLTLDQLNEAIRQQYFALSEVVDVGLTKSLQDALAESINRGSTLAEFFKQYDSLDPVRSLTSSYIENVFRTESANLYSAQNKANEEQLEKSGTTIWGYQLYAVDDQRVRPSHLALNGLYVEKGSAEDISLGQTPWAFQCRCQRVPLTSSMAEVMGIKQSVGLAEKIAHLERFAA